MKKAVLVLIMLGLLASVSNAIMFGAYGLGGNQQFKNHTLTTSNTVYSVTLETYFTTSINIQAIGGDVNQILANNPITTEAYWTIGSGQTYSDLVPIPLDKNKILYFWSPTAGAKVQIRRCLGK